MSFAPIEIFVHRKKGNFSPLLERIHGKWISVSNLRGVLVMYMRYFKFHSWTGEFSILRSIFHSEISNRVNQFQQNTWTLFQILYILLSFLYLYKPWFRYTEANTVQRFHFKKKRYRVRKSTFPCVCINLIMQPYSQNFQPIGSRNTKQVPPR